MDKKNPDLKKPHYYGKEDDVTTKSLANQLMKLRKGE